MNKTSQYKLCILIPIFNEQDNLLNLKKQLLAFCPISKLQPVCVLLVNDGSTDNTASIIKQICEENDNFFYLNLAHAGISSAVKAAIDYCESPYLGYIDADLQTSAEDFNLLIPYCEQYQLVIGVRVDRKDTIVKKISSKIGNGIRRMFTKDGISDTGCPLKLINTAYAKRMPFFSGLHRFIAALIQLQGGKVKEVAVRHFPRTAGVSKFGVWNRMFKPLADCFAVRWMRKRYINYNVESTNLQ